MKCCIIYTGSYNLTDFSLESHEILFTLLKENKIEFDVYISVANEIHLKAFYHDDVSIQNRSRKTLHDLQKTYNMPLPPDPNAHFITTWKTIDESYVKERFENLIGKENIKHFDCINSEDGGRAWEQNNYPYSGDKDLHFIEGLFENNFYKRTLRLADIIPKETYGMYVQLRPDFKMTSLDSNCIIRQKEKYIKYFYGRIDFIYFSNFIFTDYLNKANYNYLLTTEDPTDPECLLNIKKNEQYNNRMGQQFLPQYFNKFNIGSSSFSVGSKLDCYTVFPNYKPAQRKTTYVLDCTLRDGGYINNWRFNEEFINEYINLMDQMNIYMVEIGFINTITSYKGELCGATHSINEKYIERFLGHSFKICALCDYGNINYKLLETKPKIDLIRVAFHKKDMPDAINVCNKIKQLGYDVSVNAMAITNYTDEELLQLIKLVNDNNLDILYIADSFGSLNQRDIVKYLTMLNKNLIDASIGIHLHNNMNNAFSNFICSNTVLLKNNFFVDCTLYGMGRGAGNLQTELVLNNNSIPNEKLFLILTFINNYIKKLFNTNINNWGYDIDYFLGGVLKIHPNYINKLRDLKLSFHNVLFILNLILENKKHHYFDLDFINEIINRFNDRLL